MAARKSDTTAPVIDPFVLPELRAGDPGELGPSEGLDAVEFREVSVEELRLGGARLDGCLLADLHAAEADLRGITLTESVIERANIPVLRGARTRWRDVRVAGGRIGSAELYDSSWESVEFAGCKLGFVNLRASRLHDVRFADCTIEELDLGDAETLRIALPGTRIGRLDVSNASLRHTDLRGAEFDELAGARSLGGAIVDTGQLGRLAPVLAHELGIVVAD